MKAVIYSRVSTEEQAAEGVSLDAQRAKIQAWCQLNEFELLEVCADEGISAKRADNRPELQLACAAGKTSGQMPAEPARLMRG